MKISVNILTWQCLDVLGETIDKIFDEVEFTTAEVIVVDNGSTDGTKEFIESRLSIYNNLKYIRFEENQGICKGKNAGIAASKGDYIMFLDGDIDPVKNSIRLLYNYLEENPDQYAIGFRPDAWSNQKGEHEKVCIKLHNIEPIDRACIYYGMYRRIIFEKGLLFSEDGEFGLPGYGWEDHDFLERMKMRGIVQMVADINHDNGKYYHAINSSIRVMGRQKYIDTSKARHEEFKKSWNE